MIVSLNAGCGAFSDADKPRCVRERDGYIMCQRKPCVRTSRRFQIRDPVTSDHELGECGIGDEDAQAQRGQKIPLLVSEYGMIGRRERRTMVLGKVSKQTEDLRVRYKLLARGQLLTTLVSTLVKQIQIEVGFVIAYADLVLRLPCPAELRENKLFADLNIAWATAVGRPSRVSAIPWQIRSIHGQQEPRQNRISQEVFHQGRTSSERRALLIQADSRFEYWRFSGGMQLECRQV